MNPTIKGLMGSRGDLPVSRSETRILNGCQRGNLGGFRSDLGEDHGRLPRGCSKLDHEGGVKRTWARGWGAGGVKWGHLRGPCVLSLKARPALFGLGTGWQSLRRKFSAFSSLKDCLALGCNSGPVHGTKGNRFGFSW